MYGRVHYQKDRRFLNFSKTKVSILENSKKNDMLVFEKTEDCVFRTSQRNIYGEVIFNFSKLY